MANEPHGPSYWNTLLPRYGEARVPNPGETYPQYSDRVASEILEYNLRLNNWRRRPLALRRLHPFRGRRPLRGIYPDTPSINPFVPWNSRQNWRNRLGSHIRLAKMRGARARVNMALRDRDVANGAQGRYIPPEIRTRIASFL